MPALNHDDHHNHILEIHRLYKSLGYTPPHSQFTILAAVYLTHAGSGRCKIISLGTGTKSIPLAKLSDRGELVRDSHAEVIARRGAIVWLLEEIGRIHSRLHTIPNHLSEKEGTGFSWLQPCSSSTTSGATKYRLNDGVEMNFYVSTLPCGDASMRYLATIQDEEMALLKDSTSSSFPTLEPAAPSRGRDDYSRLGVLRTKPGRADSPTTHCMSCSDKIARWNVLGIQGAVASNILEPVYISTMIIGEVGEEMRSDCERAFWGRLDALEGQDLPPGYLLHEPRLVFTDVPFMHSKAVLQSNGSSNETICWVDGRTGHEILINGLKRGVSPKHRYREKSRPKLSEIARFHLFVDIEAALGGISGASIDGTYLDLKMRSEPYLKAKEILLGPTGPFSGWLRTDLRYYRFSLDVGHSKEGNI